MTTTTRSPSASRPCPAQTVHCVDRQPICQPQAREVARLRQSAQRLLFALCMLRGLSTRTLPFFLALPAPSAHAASARFTRSTSAMTARQPFVAHGDRPDTATQSNYRQIRSKVRRSRIAPS